MPKISQSFPQPEVWHKHRVFYGETDAMKVVYYANYLTWFEIARNSYIHKQGLSYIEIESRGVFLPVREAHCRYYKPARFDDIIYIRAGIGEWKRASFKFIYEITNESKTKVIATGYTIHPCVNATGKPIAVPDWLKQACICK
ncbi:MAG: thioesterase family protein [Desulfonauticus sp.]|nr:thioesterase family protein [Desulfonauticus sp.]